MADESPIDDETLAGVYQALCEYGYADLTMARISDACGKSTSLLHYHYDTKEDLLVAFLDQLLSKYERYIRNRADRPPVVRLVEFVGWYVFPPAETDRVSYHAALLELRSQGPYNERIRRKLEASDTLLRETVEGILQSGIDDGVFEPVDVEQIAALLVATLDGARTRQLTAGDPFEESFYTRIVAEATLDRIIEPLVTEQADLPDLDEILSEIPARTGDKFWMEADAE